MRPVSFSILVAGALILAGCAGPSVPADAVRDTHDGVPEAELAGWTEQADTAVRFYGHFTNQGKPSTVYFNHHEGGPWNLTVLDPDDEPIIIDPRAGCSAYQYDTIAPYAVEEYQYTWTYTQYDHLAPCGGGESPPGHRAPAGGYTAVLRFLFAYEPDDAFEIVLPFIVPAPAGGGIAAGTVETTASVRSIEGGWNLSAVAQNQAEQGVPYRDGCEHEWEWRVEDMEGETVHTTQATCLGFQQATLGPGETDRFWNHWDGTHVETGEQVPPGGYTFTVAFLHGDGERSEDSVPFQVG